MIPLLHVLSCTKKRISAELYACYVMVKDLKVKVLRCQCHKERKCNSSVNLRLVTPFHILDSSPRKIPAPWVLVFWQIYVDTNLSSWICGEISQDECRRQMLLQHFGESFDRKACKYGSNPCDNCLKNSSWAYDISS